jgi:hypothetical protein
VLIRRRYQESQKQNGHPCGWPFINCETDSAHRKRATAHALSSAARSSSIQVESDGIGAAATVTAVTAVAELLFVFGSLSAAATEAVFETDVLLFGIFSVSVIVAAAPLAREPRVQVMGEPFTHEPCVVVAETKVVPAGSVSDTTTLLAPFTPLFITVIV